MRVLCKHHSDATHTQRSWAFTMVVQHSSSLSQTLDAIYCCWSMKPDLGQNIYITVKMGCTFVEMYNPPSVVHYLRKKDQSKYNGCAHNEPKWEECSIQVEECLQWVEGDKDHGSHNTGDIDCYGDMLGIIQSFSFYSSNWEWKDECNNLQECLVAIEDTQSNVTTCWVTDVELVLEYNPCRL